MYQIQIAVTSSGITLIGARNIADHSRVDDTDRVFGIQIGHRCAVETPDGYRIMTPTEARKQGYTRLEMFPGPRH